ncbi:hypothetical protein [uncultured Acetobacteroides sp.]|uniref:hypothetical protein n=1 Tax=uncultured Acetobacteroides sp. TaxID=1760811 RepID=UPI0029F52CBA|nr:hypothetical protein [uncultured Acetobacteroides sp.]
MARKKRTSAAIDLLKVRLAGLLSIDEKLVLEYGVSVAEGTRLLNNGEAILQSYNTTLSIVDDRLYELEGAEKVITDFCSKTLSEVLLKYGKDSKEYEKVGGKRSSDVKRKQRKPKKGKSKAPEA